MSRTRFGATVAASRASGIAMNLRRSTFAPRSLGTTNATSSAARKTANRPNSRRAPGTRAVTAIPRTPNDDARDQIGDAERELALLREEAAQRELERRRPRRSRRRSRGEASARARRRRARARAAAARAGSPAASGRAARRSCVGARVAARRSRAARTSRRARTGTRPRARSRARGSRTSGSRSAPTAPTPARRRARTRAPAIPIESIASSLIPSTAASG